MVKKTTDRHLTSANGLNDSNGGSDSSTNSKFATPPSFSALSSPRKENLNNEKSIELTQRRPSSVFSKSDEDNDDTNTCSSLEYDKSNISIEETLRKPETANRRVVKSSSESDEEENERTASKSKKNTSEKSSDSENIESSSTSKLKRTAERHISVTPDISTDSDDYTANRSAHKNGSAKNKTYPAETKTNKLIPRQKPLEQSFELSESKEEDSEQSSKKKQAKELDSDKEEPLKAISIRKSIIQAAESPTSSSSESYKRNTSKNQEIKTSKTSFDSEDYESSRTRKSKKKTTNSSSEIFDLSADSEEISLSCSASKKKSVKNNSDSEENKAKSYSSQKTSVDQSSESLEFEEETTHKSPTKKKSVSRMTSKRKRFEKSTESDENDSVKARLKRSSTRKLSVLEKWVPKKNRSIRRSVESSSDSDFDSESRKLVHKRKTINAQSTEKPTISTNKTQSESEKSEAEAVKSASKKEVHGKSSDSDETTRVRLKAGQKLITRGPVPLLSTMRRCVVLVRRVTFSDLKTPGPPASLSGSNKKTESRKTYQNSSDSDSEKEESRRIRESKKKTAKMSSKVLEISSDAKNSSYIDEHKTEKSISNKKPLEQSFGSSASKKGAQKSDSEEDEPKNEPSKRKSIEQSSESSDFEKLETDKSFKVLKQKTSKKAYSEEDEPKRETLTRKTLEKSFSSSESEKKGNQKSSKKKTSKHLNSQKEKKSDLVKADEANAFNLKENSVRKSSYFEKSKSFMPTLKKKIVSDFEEEEPIPSIDTEEDEPFKSRSSKKSVKNVYVLAENDSRKMTPSKRKRFENSMESDEIVSVRARLKKRAFKKLIRNSVESSSDSEFESEPKKPVPTGRITNQSTKVTKMSRNKSESEEDEPEQSDSPKRTVNYKTSEFYEKTQGPALLPSPMRRCVVHVKRAIRADLMTTGPQASLCVQQISESNKKSNAKKPDKTLSDSDSEKNVSRRTRKSKRNTTKMSSVVFEISSDSEQTSESSESEEEELKKSSEKKLAKQSDYEKYELKKKKPSKPIEKFSDLSEWEDDEPAISASKNEATGKSLESNETTPVRSKSRHTSTMQGPTPSPSPLRRCTVHVKRTNLAVFRTQGSPAFPLTIRRCRVRVKRLNLADLKDFGKTKFKPNINDGTKSEKLSTTSVHHRRATSVHDSDFCYERPANTDERLADDDDDGHDDNNSQKSSDREIIPTHKSRNSHRKVTTESNSDSDFEFK